MKNQYAAIDRMIDRVRGVFSGEDGRVGQVFENCIGDTLDNTVKRMEDGSVYVITGDIPAMWLRDSACQLMPYVRFAAQEPGIREILVKVIETQARCILLDPYANAFTLPGTTSIWTSDRTAMKPGIWERKYETDSLCHPVNLAWTLWKKAGTTEHFTPAWKRAAERIVETLQTETDHENRSEYRFQRDDCVFTDTLSRDGMGALVKPGIGLIWSGFRPSDDSCVYGYFIPANMFAAVTLERIGEISEEVYGDHALAGRARSFAAGVRRAIGEYAVLPHTAKPYYAYEVDGFGQYLVMDDANIPSLLALPLLGWCDADDRLYLNTREVILSEHNPFYYEGKYLRGIGSPHIPVRYVWHIALAVQGLTAADCREKLDCIRQMVNSDAGTGMMHEGVFVDDPACYTRPWFSWANAMFCELVMDYLDRV
ncbi:MAG: glycoside hydrolase family 125 protein [Clostridia bacterium]|nr:glycoside hydrolase family 125 protein [Clostridia bacterium]